NIADCSGSGTNPYDDIGGACFDVTPGGKVTITINDKTGMTVGSSYLFNNSKDLIGGALGDPTKFQDAATFCGTTADVTVPAGSASCNPAQQGAAPSGAALLR